MECRNYILYNPRPVPESHIGGRKPRMGLRSARRHRLEDRIKAIERRDRTNPHTSEYERFHLPARLEANLLEAAFASLPRSPSIEKTNGVKVRRRAMHKAPYLSFYKYLYRDSWTIGPCRDWNNDHTKYSHSYLPVQVRAVHVCMYVCM
jgi:hypothetical protein